MPDLNLPADAQVLKDQNRADIQNQIPESDPFVEENWVTAVSDSNANRQFDFYLQLPILRGQMFWDTTDGESLDRWANIWIGPKNAATQSTGNVVATGTVFSAIASGLSLTDTNGLVYETTSATAISTTVANVTTITSVGTTASVELEAPESLGNNVSVTISGAIETVYNGVFSIVVLDDGTVDFTYILPSDFTGSATTLTQITATFDSAVVPVTSQDFGVDTEKSLNETLTFTGTIAGIDSQTRVDQSGLGGGADIESPADYRSRMLERVRGFLAFYTVDTIKVFIRDNVPGVTKVWVFSPDDDQGGSPGQTVIYFIRGNDDDIIPSASEVLQVKTLMDDKQMPANQSTLDLFVFAPAAIPADFIFFSISPDTVTMRSSIEANLVAFFLDQTEVGEVVTTDQYRAAIQNTFDTETGAPLDTFSLNIPISDLGGVAGTLVTFGSVSFQ